MSYVKGAAGHLLNLINDVLDLAKIEAGRVQLHPEVLSFQSELNEVLPVLRSIALQKDIALGVAAGDHVLFADRLRFKQMIYNLVSNALKFTPAKGEVSVSAVSSETGITVTVADTGAGISADEQAAIFDKYYQAGQRRAPRDGTGLGLAITKSLVEQHGGRIWVESEGTNKGSRFHFELPYARSANREGGTDTGADEVLIEAPAPELLTVALVEDDPAARALVEEMLVPPFRVTSFERGSDALREIPQLKPDVVLLDMSLPDMSGIDVLQKLRAVRRLEGVPIIGLSAQAMTGDQEKFLAAGFDAFVCKPITDRVELKREIERLCRKAGQAASRPLPSRAVTP
jgi:CheY-like chemotaxis protein/two-component sensor histidine kinase